MTNELAIRILTDVLGMAEQTQEAITMAVRALSQPDVVYINIGDTISRQDAINLLKKWSDGYKYIETETELGIKEFQHLRSAQPERKIGRWIIEPGIGCKCTACGFDIGNDLDFMEYVRYCPNCGASMEEQECE